MTSCSSDCTSIAVARFKALLGVVLPNSNAAVEVCL